MTQPSPGGTLSAIRAALAAGDVSPVELVERALSRAAEIEHLGAFVSVAPERARAEALQRESELRCGHSRGPLHGMPVAVKDLFDVAGEVTSAGSRVPPTGVPAERDAEAVRLLRDAGAIVIGRTRTHEYAWGLTTQHEVLGGARNPYDPARVPGGSSGGSAVAVATGVVPLALGTDTAGSIRLPAAWCGLVGHKPTHGLVDLTGAVPLAPSFDSGGALVRTVEDARLALQVLSGRSVPRTPVDPRRLRVGQPLHPDMPAVDSAVVAVQGAAVKAIEAAGAELVDVPMPSWPELLDVFRAVQASEALAYHRALGHWPRAADRYGSDVRSRLEAAEGFAVDGTYERLAALRNRVRIAMADVDVLLSPAAGAGPSRCSEPDVVLVDGVPTELRQAVLSHTLLASVCGLPGCAVPVGLADGMPVGVQVIGRAGEDPLVLDVAELVEKLAVGA